MVVSKDIPLPTNIVFEVTHACNCDCRYCYNVWKSPNQSYPKGLMKLAEIQDLFERLLDEVPLQSVAISGGEPFLRKDLPEIVSYLWARGLNVVIITNGTMLSQENIERTCGAINYEVPLLSYRKEVHNYLMRYDSFPKVIKGMKNLWKAKARFVVAFIATRLNAADLERTVQLAIAMGAEAIQYNRMNAGAYNYQYLSELLPTVEMIKDNLDTLQAMSVQFGIPVSCSVPIPPCLIDIQQYPDLYFGFCPLAGENSYFTIDPAGNLRVCNHSSTILGNLREQSFHELYMHPYVRDFKYTLPSNCLSCQPQYRDRCHGGCKMAAAECYGSFREDDPFVRLG